MASSSKELEEPEKITLADQVFAIDFHPKRDLIGIGLVNGEVELWQYSNLIRGNSRCWKTDHHQLSCRHVKFSRDGSVLFTGSADNSISVIDVATGKVLHRIPSAHGDGISALACDELILASGCDEGVVKCWDIRQKLKPTWTFEETHDDYITDLQIVRAENTLVASSGDGTISALHLRRGKEINHSDECDEEPLCLALFPDHSHVVAGTQEGGLRIWKWGQWGFPVGKFNGHPQAVDTICHLEGNTFATGSSDGLIRLIQLNPNQLLGVIGSHNNFPIEKLTLSREGRYLGSCSHDRTVRFWNIVDDDPQPSSSTPTCSSSVQDDDGGRDSSDSDDAPRTQQRKTFKVKKNRFQGFYDDL